MCRTKGTIFEKYCKIIKGRLSIDKMNVELEMKV